MNPTERSPELITENDLRKILLLAQRDIESFFDRNPRYKPYYGKECLIALGQGGALHYIDKQNGVKDFDVWFLYPAIDGLILPFRRRGVVDFGESKFGRHPDDRGFKGRKIDVMMRSDKHFNKENPVSCIQSYLKAGDTTTAQMLAMKAMVGLYPDDLFGEVLWNGFSGKRNWSGENDNIIERLNYRTGTLVKLTVSPTWSHENRTTIRIVHNGGAFKLVCRKISQMVKSGFSSKQKENYREWTLDVSGGIIKKCFSTLEGVMVPVLPEYESGCDGTDYTLELSIGHKLKYSWWSVPPKGYEPLEQFVDQLWELSKADEQPDVYF